MTKLTARLVKPAAKKGAKKPRTKAGGKGAHRKVIATAKRKRTKRTPARAHTTSRERTPANTMQRIISQ